MTGRKQRTSSGLPSQSHKCGRPKFQCYLLLFVLAICPRATNVTGCMTSTYFLGKQKKTLFNHNNINLSLL